MSSKIRILSEQTINQIAAGEVIENPASVVKELVENAIDAGSKRIVIEVKGGGQQLLRIVDDGCGMNRDDALLCLERHATSKIYNAEDLWSLNTMGFRGEALASIASISHLTLISSLGVSSLEGEGTKIEVEGGRQLSISPYPRTRGTTVEVRSLFYNVPARKKFQKSSAASSAEILRLMTAMSLAYPAIHFELIQQERPSLTATPQSLKERIGEMLGEEFGSSLKELDIDASPYRITGFIGSPAYTRLNRTGQYLFINKRCVHSPQISYAVQDGYGTRLDARRYPVYVLNIDLPPALIDVNVHPQKREVRFREEASIKEKIREAVSQSFLLPSSHVPSPSFNVPSFQTDSFFSSNLRFREERDAVEHPSFLPPIQTDAPQPLCLFKHYLLMKQPSCLMLVDLIAARSRILFEAMQQGNQEKIISQELVLPASLSLQADEVATVESHLPLFEEAGFVIRLSSAHSIAIDAMPPFLHEEEGKEIVLQMVHDLTEQTPIRKPAHHRRAALALRQAKTGRAPQTLEEAVSIFEALQRTSSPEDSPFGKPTIRYLNEETLKSYFSQTAGKIKSSS